MRFIIKQAGTGSERVGSLSGFARSSGTVIETPTAALFTKGGSVAHLTLDILSRVFSNPRLLWVPLASSIHLENGAKAQGEGVAKFAGLANHVTCCSVNDFNEKCPPGHFELDYVPLWTRNGKKKVDSHRYMDAMEAFKPDMILAIADSQTSLTEPHKRILKSVDRTGNLLDVCIDRYKDSKQLQCSSLIGVIVGASRPKDCDVCVKKVLSHIDMLSGIALSGLMEGGEDTAKCDVEKLKTIFKRVTESTPRDLLHILEGSWNPEVVVSAIEQGWDLFDGSYPAMLTNNGQALVLSLGDTVETVRSGELCILDLNDKRYAEDFSPLLAGCTCLSCRQHSRAYLHHLLNTREMLASVLLSIHNLHHFEEMFRAARRHISANTFQTFKRSIVKQYEMYKESVHDKKETVDILKEPTHNKKKRLSADEGVTVSQVNGKMAS